jgi:hypothetical protein
LGGPADAVVASLQLRRGILGGVAQLLDPVGQVVEGHVDDAPRGRGHHQQRQHHGQDARHAPVEHVDDGVDEHRNHRRCCEP